MFQVLRLLLSIVLVFQLLNIGSTSAQTSVSILSVAWSPDGTQIAVGQSNATIAVWDAQSAELLFTLSGHQEEVLALDWSPDGTSLASGSSDGSVRIWNIETQQSLRVIQDVPQNSIRRPILDVAWSADSNFVAGARDAGTITIWSVETGERQSFYIHDSMALTVDWHPSLNLLASGGLDGQVLVWDAASQRIQTFIPADQPSMAAIYSVAWSPNGDQIAVSAGRGGVQVGLFIFDYAANESTFAVPSISTDGAAINWNPNGREIAISVLGQTSIVNINTGDTVDTVDVGSSLSSSISWSPYGARLIIPNVPSTSREQLNSLFHVVVPAPSLERLQSIADLCIASQSTRDGLTTGLTESNLDDFATQVRAASHADISPGCAADLLAVAEAIQ